MPSGKLSFLRPLYDIAVWQFCIQSNFTKKGLKKEKTSKTLSDGKPVLSFGMQECIANMICKLLSTPTFEYLLEKFTSEDAKKAAGGWTPGSPATLKLTEWCQDQWRRKQPVLPNSQVVRSHMCIPLFSESVPLCYRCSIPCADCCQDLELNIPPELSTAQAILKDYQDVHSDHESEESEGEDVEPPPKRMCLRSRVK